MRTSRAPIVLVIPIIGLAWLASASAPQPLRGQPAPARSSMSSGTLALAGGMLLTGYDVPPIHHAAVIVERGKIVAAGPASEVKIPAGAP
jgi:hypothetical protein